MVERRIPRPAELAPLLAEHCRIEVERPGPEHPHRLETVRTTASGTEGSLNR